MADLAAPILNKKIPGLIWYDGKIVINPNRTYKHKAPKDSLEPTSPTRSTTPAKNATGRKVPSKKKVPSRLKMTQDLEGDTAGPSGSA